MNVNKLPFSSSAVIRGHTLCGVSHPGTMYTYKPNLGSLSIQVGRKVVYTAGHQNPSGYFYLFHYTVIILYEIPCPASLLSAKEGNELGFTYDCKRQ